MARAVLGDARTHSERSFTMRAPLSASFVAVLFAVGCGSSTSDDDVVPTDDSGAPQSDAGHADAHSGLSDSGSDAGNHSDAAPPVANGTSFDANLTVTSVQTSAKETFVVHFYIDEAASVLTIGWHGSVGTGPITKLDDGWSTTAAISLQNDCIDGHSFLGMQFASIEIHRTPTGITGTSAGSVQILDEDVIDTANVTSVFDGIPDIGVPHLDFCGLKADTTLDVPITWLSLAPSEPLAAGATASLVRDDGTTIALTPKQTSGPVAEYQDDFTFAFGKTYHIAFSPFTDMAGISGVASALPTIVTPSLDFISLDGFETTSPALLKGNAQIGSAPDLPAITGSRSLIIPGGDAFAARVRVSATSKTLTGKYRPAFPANSNEGSLGIAIGIPEGPATWTYKASDTSSLDGGTNAAVLLGNVVTFSVPLPSGIKDEIVLQLTSSGASPIFGTMGATHIVDDLKIE